MKTKILNYILALITFGAFILLIAFLADTDNFQMQLLVNYRGLIIKGFMNTLIVSFLSLILSIVLGFILYIMQKSNMGYFVALGDVFTEIIYGTPMLVLIVITRYVIGPAFNYSDTFVLGIIAIVLYMAPYMTNVFKAAISSIGDDQYIAIELFGFTSYQKYRYIIMPQIIKQLMPPMMNNLSLIIKGSALLHAISYTELFYAIKIAQSKTFAYIEGYILLWLLYLVVTIPLSQLTKYVERRYGV
ncbi:amino acid ABC transporter permease [Mycoplasmatota bacterium WC44]